MDASLRKMANVIVRLTMNTGAVPVVTLAKHLETERDKLIAPLADLARCGHIALWIDTRGHTQVALMREPKCKKPNPRAKQAINMDSLEDRRALEPHEIASAREAIERNAPMASERKPVDAPLPRPAIFLVGVQCWPPKRFAFAPWQCQVCRDAPMRRSTYCGHCDRSGLDGDMPKARTARRRKLA